MRDREAQWAFFTKEHNERITIGYAKNPGARDAAAQALASMRRELVDAVLSDRAKFLTDTVDVGFHADLTESTTELALFLAWERERAT